MTTGWIQRLHPTNVRIDLSGIFKQHLTTSVPMNHLETPPKGHCTFQKCGDSSNGVRPGTLRCSLRPPWQRPTVLRLRTVSEIGLSHHTRGQWPENHPKYKQVWTGQPVFDWNTLYPLRRKCLRPTWLSWRTVRPVTSFSSYVFNQ